jgi:hypothetical protein
MVVILLQAVLLILLWEVVFTYIKKIMLEFSSKLYKLYILNNTHLLIKSLICLKYQDKQILIKVFQIANQNMHILCKLNEQEFIV